MRILRFLEKYEYIRTLKLFIECFGNDEEYISKLYGELDGENECTGTIRAHEIIVIENELGNILSMVHIRPMAAQYPDKKISVGYIMCVATAESHRHQGLMDELMKAAEDYLRQRGDKWCFLVAVDKDIYRHLGYIYDWKFNKDEALLLDADEGLTECSAKLLNAKEFEPPKKLSKQRNF